MTLSTVLLRTIKKYSQHSSIRNIETYMAKYSNGNTQFSFENISADKIKIEINNLDSGNWNFRK